MTARRRKKVFNLADEVDPGTNRVWVLTHQPAKQTKPVRLELREYTVEKRETTPLSFTRLLGYIDTIADETEIVEAAKTLDTRVGRVDQFVGVYEKKEK